MSLKTFKGPARYTVYGGVRDGQVARISGAETLAAVDDIIEKHKQSYPGCDYRIWEATWKEVKQ
jgi:hypothetical protein